MLAFRSLLIHTCTMQRIQIVAQSAASYGHTVRNERVITASYPLIPCRVSPMTPEEQQGLWDAHQIRAQYTLYLVYTRLPQGLSPWTGWSEFQVTTIVARKNGTVIDSGPLDITNIVNQAGESHHIRMSLYRGT